MISWRRIAAFLVSTALLSSTIGSAEAACGDLGQVDGVGLGLLAPEPHCKKQLVLDVNYSLYGSTAPARDEPMATRFGTDLGFVARVTDDKGPNLHLGGVVGISFGGLDPELGGKVIDWQLAPKAKLRWWLGWTTFEASLGPTVTFSNTAQGRFARPGAYLEVGPRIFGFLGIFVSGEILGGAGPLPSEERVGAGLTITIGVGALGAAVAGYAAACSKALCI